MHFSFLSFCFLYEKKSSPGENYQLIHWFLPEQTNCRSENMFGSSNSFQSSRVCMMFPSAPSFPATFWSVLSIHMLTGPSHCRERKKNISAQQIASPHLVYENRKTLWKCFFSWYFSVGMLMGRVCWEVGGIDHQVKVWVKWVPPESWMFCSLGEVEVNNSIFHSNRNIFSESPSNTKTKNLSFVALIDLFLLKELRLKVSQFGYLMLALQLFWN